ncbi:SLAC1 anion channel family protein [Sinisalibacter aestuarii]|uniref:Transporter n=1 Tax=Sinisalibacter aestuarii TaxID=2949426 RepID=A0ABQ5LUT8_9RHOB|nr:SLAC1 anion channel family protein [Sinisalibacter aestuarii]GKY88031.1 transporter [Sinisalibacter aestuarii]
MTDAQPEPRLKHFPITFFAVVMGLMGLTLAFHAASPVYPLAETAAQATLWVGLAAAGLIAAFYIAKALRYPAMVAWEWHHPVRLAFFPTITISLLLMAAALSAHSPGLARIVWLIGVAGQGVLTVAVINGWISHRSFEVGHLTPAWFIPAVGNVIVPVAGAEMGYIETSWAFFAVGMMFWGVLLTLVMNRLIFHDPIPGRLFPTMVILIAPPSVAFVAYVKMTGGVVDGFARVLIYAGWFFAALVIAELPKLARLPFALSWWALSFPLAALAIASFLFGRIEHSAFHQNVGLVVLLILFAVVLGLIFRTVKAIARHEICHPE